LRATYLEQTNAGYKVKSFGLHRVP